MLKRAVLVHWQVRTTCEKGYGGDDHHEAKHLVKMQKTGRTLRHSDIFKLLDIYFTRPIWVFVYDARHNRKFPSESLFCMSN